MRQLRAFLIRLGWLFRTESSESEFAEEMETHLQMQIEDNLRSGMPPAEARREALIKSGGLESAKESYRERRGLPLIDALLQDFRYAVRALRKSPGFTSVAVMTLAVGIGANTALFSLVDAVLLRPLPYREADRLVAFSALVSYSTYQDWKNRSQTLSDLAFCTRDSPVTLTGPGEPERVDASRASPDLFTALGVPPLLGRTFSAADVEREQPVVVIAYTLWQRRFAGVTDILGRTIALDGQIATVIGVMPPAFQFPSANIQLWQAAGSPFRTARGNPFGLVVGRLRADTTLDQAQKEMGGSGVNVITLQQQIAGKPVRMALWTLLGAGVFVLLIGCTNVANLLLARGTVRQRELAVRAALGAGRSRIVGQLMVENMTLCSLAGTAGILLAFLALRGLVALAPAGTPRLGAVGIDLRVLTFTLAMSFLCGLLFGLLPAWQASKCDPQQTLKSGGHGQGGRPPGQHAQSVLIVVEVAMAVVLLCGAGLMVRSFVRLHQVPLGFQPENALVFRVAMPDGRNTVQQAAFYAAAFQRLRTIPAAVRAGAISNFFLTYSRGTTILIDGAPDAEQVMDDSASPDFFATLGVTLRRGRFFTGMDDERSQPVALVNETLAQRCWPAEDALGRRFRFLDGRFGERWVTVVGIVGDMRRNGVEREPLGDLFLPLSQRPSRAADFVIRTSGDPLRVASAARRELASLEPDLPVFRISTLEQRLASAVTPRRFQTELMSLFAAVALFLAAIGIYGVIHYSVAQRTNEIGIRMALGARPAPVLTMVIRQGVLLVSIGLAIGVAGALLLNRFFSSLPLFGVTPTDPTTFTLVTALIGAVAVLACCVPAWRATSIHPMLALRYE